MSLTGNWGPPGRLRRESTFHCSARRTGVHTITRRTWLGACLSTAVGSLVPAHLALAQVAGWPNRPVRIIVPFSAAGTTDIIARLLVEPLTTRLGQSVVVENCPGAGGNIGADAVAKSTDNHTLLMTQGHAVLA